MAHSGHQSSNSDASPTESDRGRSSAARSLLLAVVLVTSVGAVGLAAGQPGGGASASVAGPDGALAGGADVAPAGSAQEAQPEGNESVSLSVENVTNCGDRCRTVTANLTNNGTEELENVTADTRITAGDTQLWERTYRFGNLSVNESANRTARISLGFADALRVARNDGWITVNSTVRWDGGNATFTERRRVLR